jgi:hypothetical protein
MCLAFHVGSKTWLAQRREAMLRMTCGYGLGVGYGVRARARVRLRVRGEGEGVREDLLAHRYHR